MDSDDESCGLREQKKRETRRALHHAALHLVHDRGLGEVTVEQIAAAAGVSPRTFFNYFPTKEEAVLGFTHDFVQRVVHDFEARPVDEDPWVSLMSVAARMILGGHERREEDRATAHEVMLRHPELARGMAGATHALREAVLQAVQERLEAQGVAPHEALHRAIIYLDLATAAVSTAMNLSRTGDLSIDQAFAQVQRTIASIGAPTSVEGAAVG